MTPLDAIDIKTADVNLPYSGQPYIHLGYSNNCQYDTPFSVTLGGISCTKFDNHGHIRGGHGSRRGDSGGPVFSFYNGELIGMVVGCDHDNASTTPYGLKTVIVPAIKFFN